MKKIYFPKAWGENDVLKMFIHQTPNSDGIWEDVVAVKTKEEADYIIVQDGTSEDVDYNKVIYFGREPHYIQGINQKWLNNECYAFFHHEKNNSWMPQTWWVGINFSELSNLKNINKTKNLSVIESGKKMVYGHKKRNEILSKIIKNNPKDIDVFGRITSGKENSGPYKTTLPYRKKENGLIDYRYNLAIENGSTDFYFSEKIVDPLLCWTMPIYWGCKNIEKFLPKGSYVNIDINNPNISDVIIEISKSNIREENLELIAEARDLILNKYNLWPSIKRAIDNKKML